MEMIEVEGVEVIIDLDTISERMTVTQAFELGIQLINKAKQAWPYCERQDTARVVYGYPNNHSNKINL